MPLPIPLVILSDDGSAPSTPLAVERHPLVVKADNALMLGAVTLMASPVAAQAAEITPSLKNLLGSVVAGGVIFGALFGAVYVVSSFDKLDARR